jgi:hypothetical protein
MYLLFREKKKRHWKVFPSVLLFLTFLLIPVFTSAAEPEDIPGNIHIGQLKIHPDLSVKEGYTDNIFREADSEKGSAITTVSPGILFQLPIKRHFLQMDYRADLIEASKHHDVYDTDSHFANLLLNLDFNRLNLLMGDNWAKDSTPPDFENDTRNDYYQNRAFFEASYRLPGRYKVKAFYTNEFRDFDDYREIGQSNPELDNYMQNETGVALYYRFLPLTSVLLEYAFTTINNKDINLPDTDSDSHRIWLGLSWEPTAKINGAIKGGYVTRDYDEAGDDWDGFGMEGDLKYNYSSFTSFSFKGFRKLLDASVTQMAPGGVAGDYGTYYVSTGGILSASRKLNYKLSASAEISYFHDDYQERGAMPDERRDDRVGFGVGLDYRIQDWLGCGLKYNYEDNDSNVEAEEYRENRVFATISLIF